MKFIKRVRWAYLLLSVFLIGIGVCLLLWPELSGSMACMVIGGGAMLFGLVKIVFYFVRQVSSMVEQYDFSVGLLCIGGGIFLLIQPDDLLRLLPQALAVYMLIDCVFKLQVVLDAKRLGSRVWFLQLLAVMLCIAWGVCLLLQPFGLEKYASQLLAGGLIADGALNLLTVLFIAFTVKKEPAEGSDIRKTLELILKALSVAMGTAVTVLSVLGEITLSSGFGLLGIGLASAGIYLLTQSKE